MGALVAGGGTSAVAASAHAGCRRFRLTDPFLTRKTRRSLAAQLGAPDTTAGIPEARWMRAMTFEQLVNDERFVSELLTKTIGQLGLPRPSAVTRIKCNGSVELTAKALKDADLKATFADTATMISALGVPYLFLEGEEATAVLPDFAVVAPRGEGEKTVGSWLVMGDAKDYERVRSRVDDARMLKGFLQVALGAESAAEWSELPKDMAVHRCGALAVPRNAFLQPEAVVETLDDHRDEVRGRARERLEEKERLGEDRPTEEELASYVAGIEARFDPASCVSCSLFTHCRSELRESSDRSSLLIEIGVPPRLRPAAQGIVDANGATGQVPAQVLGQISATVNGRAVAQKRGRTDPAGTPGAISVVVAKSDAAALGIHGIAVRRSGGRWVERTFLEPQAPTARRGAMELIGEAITSARDEEALPIHLIVPDSATADLLVSAADSVAGVELSRMRWQRDLDQGRPALTFDGSPAKLASPLNPAERLGAAFLLEDDRSRALRTRTTIIDIRRVLAGHFTAGGPATDAFRLDYLVEWATADGSLEHREVSDRIADALHTPGARLSNRESDAIHAAYGERGEDPGRYRQLVAEALAYKEAIVERAEAALSELPVSRLQGVFGEIEEQWQEVWWRRVALEASDLVRFGRTTEFWRNSQVELLDRDEACAIQLNAMADHAFAHDRALDAGVRELALATVLSIDPVRLDVASRRFGEGSVAVALHLNGEPLVERPETTCKVQATSFKFGQLPIGALSDEEGEPGLRWSPGLELGLSEGDELVLADGEWFNSLLQNGHELTVTRPPVDQRSAPKADCTPSSYEEDPDGHRWCCRPHAVAEAETADYFAEKRAAGEMNPETWPPLVDEERFDVGDEAPDDLEVGEPPEGLTADDLD